MANENDKKPRDKGIGEYAKDFVGDLLGRNDDDDTQAQQTQNKPAQPNQAQGEQRPHDKGIVEYTKDFVGGLFGRDDDDTQAQQTQNKPAQPNQPQAEQRPHDKGIVEYTKDFVGGLVGRDDDDDQKQPQAPAKDKDQSLAERLSDTASDAMNTARDQARQAPKSQDSFAERMQDAVQDAAEKARQQQAQQSAGSSSMSSIPAPGKSANQDEESELQRLRNRVNELEQERGHATQQAPQQQRTYTVVPGDSLSKIAKRYYGDVMQWKRIYDANRSMIDNPDLIYPGQVFEIPE